jgi:hypothetical protein
MELPEKTVIQETQFLPSPSPPKNKEEPHELQRKPASSLPISRQHTPRKNTHADVTVNNRAMDNCNLSISGIPGTQAESPEKGSKAFGSASAQDNDNNNEETVEKNNEEDDENEEDNNEEEDSDEKEDDDEEQEDPYESESEYKCEYDDNKLYMDVDDDRVGYADMDNNYVSETDTQSDDSQEEGDVTVVPETDVECSGALARAPHARRPRASCVPLFDSRMSVNPETQCDNVNRRFTWCGLSVSVQLYVVQSDGGGWQVLRVQLRLVFVPHNRRQKMYLMAQLI